MSNSPAEIQANIHLVFYPAGSSAKKRKRQATADPDSEPMSSSDSNSSSTVDTSNTEGEDEKDFILSDDPSEELTSSKSSDSEPEDASDGGLQMEKCVIKPWYESYWQGAGHNFVAHTPGFRKVMERDCFIALWGFLHLVDQMDKAVDKSDKIYKVRPMHNRMLPLFCRYYSPRQQLSLNEGKNPTKNRLIIKQYISDKPVRWGIKIFLLCEAKTGFILDAEIYTDQVKDCHWPLLGSASSVVHRLVENSQVANKNHMLFMDRFYNSVTLFHLLKNELGVRHAKRQSTTPRNSARG